MAAYLTEKASSISCIDITAVPFDRVLGARVGKMLQSVSEACKASFACQGYPTDTDLCTLQMHEEKGVKFYLSAGVKEIVGENGKVTGVTIPSGETLEADMVVAGVG